MCTLTYVYGPQVRTITANRDEDPERSAAGLSTYRNRRGDLFYMAREPLHGGTNMVIGQDQSVVVLLNGAFRPHPFGKSYKKSRGIMVLESLDFDSFPDFRASYDFDGIEPFTMVYLGAAVYELRWDGGKVYFMEYPKSESRVWASAQLYAPQVIEKRARWFSDLLVNKPSPEQVYHFHLYAGEGDPENDMVMNRANKVQTVSVTQLAVTSEEATLIHKDLIGDASDVRRWRVG